MRLELRYFASVREAVGMASETVELPAQVATVGALRDYLITRGEPWAGALAHGRALRMARNQVMCDGDTPLQDGAGATREVAFFPPVTGG